MWRNIKKKININSINVDKANNLAVDFDFEKIAKIGGWYHEFETDYFEWTDGHYELFELSKNLPQNELFSAYQAKIHPDDISHLKYLVDKAKISGEGYVYNHRVFFDDGKRIKYVKDIAVVNKDETGKPISIVGTCQDVSDTVPLQEQSRFVLQSFGIGLWQYDFIKCELIWDDSTFKLYNLNPLNYENALQAWKSIISEETFQIAEKEVYESINSGREYYSTFVTNDNENPKHIGIRGTTLKDQNGHPIKMYGMSWDRTQEIILEKKLEAERAKSIHSAKLASLGEMSASVAHEINNPLAVISATLQLIKKFKDDPIKFESKIETLKKSVERISKIVNGLRKFSKTANKSHYKDSLIQDVINEALVFVDFKAKKNEIDLTVEISDNFKLYCDPVEIEQVIINLVNNAIDAIKNQSSRWIKIKCFSKSNNSNQILNIIQVLDSGNGISNDLEEKIFQPFYTTKLLGEGTGLGLSISKSIIDQHKAKIFINHEYLNTCFEIQFSTLEEDNIILKHVS